MNGFAFKSSSYKSNGIRIIRIANVQDGFIEDALPQFYSHEDFQGLERYTLYKDDLLMSLTGNVGRVGILSSEMLPAALNQRVACIKNNEDAILKKYLFYYFRLVYLGQTALHLEKE